MIAAHFNQNEQTLAELEGILKSENPCNIQVENGVATCREGTPCCKGCTLLTAGGCLSVPPACKFFFCPTAWNFLKPETQERIQQLGATYIGPLRLRGTRQKMTSRPPYIW
jgi:hypothetical protein